MYWLLVGAISVNLTYVNVEGILDNGIEIYKNIPYALPPTGDFRLRAPRRVDRRLADVNVSDTAYVCSQFNRQAASAAGPSSTALLANTLTNVFVGAFSAVSDGLARQREDCLTLDIYRPSGKVKLPVVVYIFGGGFEFGTKDELNPRGLIARSTRLGMDLIYVAINYRLAGFGFLGGKELTNNQSTNLGLRDQRLALEWVAENIPFFGGDSTRITIWGESAGAISVYNQIVYKDSRRLFRAAIMNSGSVVPALPSDSEKPQAIYDKVVALTGCQNDPDTLGCLRRVPYERFKTATESVPAIFSYNSLALSYLPRPDDVLPISSERHGIPILIGNQKDEGTVFALRQFNISTTKDIVDYLSTFYFKDRRIVQELVDSYPEDPMMGSPFNTSFNNFYPQYKRLAAILGDMTFTLSRRLLLSSYDADAWSYQGSYGTNAFLGTYHTTDLAESFGLGESFPTVTLQTAYIIFINDMTTTWPRWKDGQVSLEIRATEAGVIRDNFRSASYDVLSRHRASLAI